MSVRTDLIIRYRRQTTEWLIQEDANLYAKLTPFTGQTQGQKSYSQDPHIITEMLAAVNMVLNERGANTTPRAAWGVTDFSCAAFGQ